MKKLVLTGLGNEVDMRTGKVVFTATFNGSIRIEISEEAANVLTSTVFTSDSETPASGDYTKPPVAEAEEFGGDFESETPSDEGQGGIYDEDTGVEQV